MKREPPRSPHEPTISSWQSGNPDGFSRREEVNARHRRTGLDCGAEVTHRRRIIWGPSPWIASRTLFPTDEPLPAERMIGRGQDVDELVAQLRGGMTLSVKAQTELGDGVELALHPGVAARDPHGALLAALRMLQTIAERDDRPLVLFIDGVPGAHQRRLRGRTANRQ
jgi:hypothetical protein